MLYLHNLPMLCVPRVEGLLVSNTTGNLSLSHGEHSRLLHKAEDQVVYLILPHFKEHALNIWQVNAGHLMDFNSISDESQ